MLMVCEPAEQKTPVPRVVPGQRWKCSRGTLKVVRQFVGNVFLCSDGKRDDFCMYIDTDTGRPDECSWVFVDGPREEA